MKNRELLGILASVGPAAIYIIYTFVTKETNSGIDWTEVLIAGILGIVGKALGDQIKNKGKVE